MHDLSLAALRSFSGVGTVEVSASTTALLLVDMQVSCVRQGGYTIRRLTERGLGEAVIQYNVQLQSVIPNLMLLLARFRDNGQVIVHTRAISMPGLQPGGRTRPGRLVPPGSDDARIIEELEPLDGELVVSKTCSGVFAGTNLDFTLRHLGITSLVIGGVVTNGCVEQAITHAHDLGYACVLVSDGSAALTNEIHDNALDRLAHRRAHVVSTGTILGMNRIEES